MKLLNISEHVSVGIFDAIPPELDLGASSRADAMRYGVPHGRSERERSLLSKVSSRLKGRIAYVEPEIEVLPPRTRLLARKKKATTTVVESDTSENWAGAVAQATGGTSFSFVSASLNVPNVSESLMRGGAYGNELFVTGSSHWVGLDSIGQVCQAGIEVDSIPKRNVAVPYVWVEWFPGPLLKVSNFPVNPGDWLGILICTDGIGSIEATASFTNFTNGATSSFKFFAPPGVSLQGATAEWITERPFEQSSDGTGGFFPLANFGDVYFTEALAGTTGQLRQPGQADVIEMVRTLADQDLICEAVSPSPGLVRTIWTGTGYVYQ